MGSGTAGNCHAYWPLTEPLARDDVEAANRRLAHALGADAASADAARILRVPPTLSYKHRPPTSVRALVVDAGRGMPAEDVVGHLADPPHMPDTSTALTDPRRDDHPLLAITPDVYVQRPLGIEVPRHRKVACPFHPDRQADPSIDDITNALWCACHGGQRPTAEMLLERGADRDWVGHNGLTCLNAAERSKATDPAAWLRASGAASPREAS